MEWAEDLTQEVFIRSWRKLEGFRGEASFGTWLHRLAVNLILSRRETLKRRSQKQLPEPGILDRIPARQGQAGFTLDFEAALQRLPDRAKQVFLLYDVEGYPHEEIAQAMGISTGTSKSQLHRARLMMREYLK
jgi:RNA polymerase sigma-70 factor (ECF subfamily)